MNIAAYVLVLLTLFVSGCSTENQPDDEHALEDNSWNELFIRNNGWFGGDGIFGIPLDGKEFVPASDNTRTLFTFGDTMIGYHNGDSLGREDFTMVNNSVGFLNGSQPDASHISFHWKESSDGKPKALFIPNTANSKAGDYYWLGDGFVNTETDSTLYIFAYLIQEKDTTGIGGFAFEQIGISLLSIPKGSKPPYEDHTQLETPFFDFESETSFGSAIYVNTKAAEAPNPDGFVYTYAVSKKDEVKGLIVARVRAESFVDFDKWQFWDGTEWSNQMDRASFIAEHVSNEMSVSPLPDGRIVLAYQYLTMSPEIVIQVGTSLVGPFGDRKTVYRTTDDPSTKDYFTYNAKAFPHLSPKGSLLVGYNVNSLDFWTDILSDPNLYRPRFFQIPLNQIK